MAAKSLWDQLEKWQQGFLNSKYYFDDFKTICQYYNKNMTRLFFFDISLLTIDRSMSILNG